MKQSLKNWLYQSKRSLFLIIAFCPLVFTGQIANYVNNGGFEDIISGTVNPPKAKYWSAFDSTKFYGIALTYILPPNNVPISGYTYQWPRHGNNFLATTFYCPTCGLNLRGYPRNRLKQTLQQGETYCFTAYLNLTNRSSYAIDEIGVYFSDSSNDTIKYCMTPIDYLSPQLKTQSNVFISDTLNWVKFNGTYTASGNEKYIVLGNFRDNANTDTLFVNSIESPEIFAAYCLDDISLININLPAYAGRDTTVLPGSSVFLGRESDVGIDEACIWYKLPDLTNPIDTIAGFTINPTSTATYVVRQQLTCSNLPKWDTVVVMVDPTVGINRSMFFSEELNIYPNPAKNYFELKMRGVALENLSLQIDIFNGLGDLVEQKDVIFKEETSIIDIPLLPNGLYLISIKNSLGEKTVKKLVISK